MFCQYVCVCITCVSGAHRGQKKRSDSLELKLQMVVSSHVCAGDLNQGPLYEKQMVLIPELALQP